MGSYVLFPVVNLEILCLVQSQAKEYFEKAADNDEVGGHYNLGVMYLKGIGVKRDVKLACKYFIVAANNGQPKAFYQLAKMFHTGVGLKKNIHMVSLSSFFDQLLLLVYYNLALGLLLFSESTQFGILLPEFKTTHQSNEWLKISQIVVGTDPLRT